MRGAIAIVLLASSCSRAPAANAPAPSPAPAPTVPPALACLARWYGGEATRDALVLPDGTSIPWDDGKTKTFEEKLAAPDVEDAFSIPYRTGKIEPVTESDHDPGRIRLDALFRHAYGKSEKDVGIVRVPFLGKDRTLPVNRKAEAAFRRVEARLEKALAADPSLEPFFRDVGGTFVWRSIAGTDRQSAHSYGVSIDLNVKLSDYWRWQKPGEPLVWKNRVPQAIVDAFEAEGFIWGGRWYHYDTMHFEWRPELFDEECLK